MKKTALLLLVVTLSLTGFSQVCTPLTATGLPGLTPLTENLPCIERGVPYDQVIYLENFVGATTPIGFLTINFLRIDSITNAPCGIHWETNKPGNTYLSGETGCIKISGTTNEPVGQYRLGLYFTVEGVLPPPFGLQQISGEASYLIATLESFTGASFGINFNYWVRVTEPATFCAALDTTSGANNLLSNCGPICQSSPPTGVPGLSPSTDSLTCIERGVYYDQVISLENFDSINIPNPPISSVVVFLRIDSITNAPCGIIWATNKPNNTLGSGETGCIRVTGTTFDNPGQYKLNMYFTIGGVVPILGPDTIILSGEASALVDSLENLFGVVIPINLNYWVRVTEPGIPCPVVDTSSSATNLIACAPNVPLSATISGTSPICEGDTSALAAVVSGGVPPYTYLWTPGNLTDSLVFAQPTANTTYSVTVTDASSATGISSFSVNVFHAPDADFNATANGLSVSFSNISSPNTLQVLWNFGDGNTSTSFASASHTYANDTLYTATLIASNNCGADTFSRQIDLRPIGIFDIKGDNPLFTVYPNPTSGNLIIRSGTIEPALYELRLFDVRGMEVYFSEIRNSSASFNHSLDLKDFPKGIYTLHLASEKTAFTGKVVLY